jgi:hypothetical protein
MGGDEGVLRGILGVLPRAEHVAAEGEDLRVMSVIDRLERVDVTPPHQRHEALVAAGSQQPPRLRRELRGRHGSGDRVHGSIMGANAADVARLDG